MGSYWDLHYIIDTLFQVCGSQNTVLPTLASSPYSALSANSAQICSSLPNPPDEVFLDRLAERFSQHPHIDVGGRPSSSATTTTTTTTSGVDEDDNVDERRGGANDDDDDKACVDDKHLPQHCFRFTFSTFSAFWFPLLAEAKKWAKIKMVISHS